MKRGSSADALAEIAALWLSPGESALLIVGEPGIGKSHFLEQLVATSYSHVELLRSNPAERAYPFTGLTLFNTWVDDVMRMPITEAMRPGSDAFDPHVAANEVLAHVRALDLPPTFVAVDDLDVMDDDSQVVVGINVGRLRGTGIRFVATATSVEGNEALAGMSRFELQPLTTEELVGLASSRVVGGDETTTRIVAGHAGGNPGVFLDQMGLLTPEQRDGRDPLKLPLPSTASIERVVSAKVEALTPAERALVERVSLAPMVHEAALTGEDRAAADLLEDLVGTSMLTRDGGYVWVADPRVRTHLYWAMGAGQRRTIHEEMAVASQAFGEYFASWHRSFGSEVGSEVGEMLAGAAWLVSIGKISEAVEFADRALSRSADRMDHATLLLALCAELLRAGQLGLAGRYVTRTLPDADVPAQSVALAVIRLTSHMFDGTAMVDADVQTLIREHAEEDTTAAVALLVVAAFRRAERWEFAQARSLIDGAVGIDSASEQSVEAIRVIEAMLDALEGLPQAAGGAEFGELQLKGHSFDPEILLLHSRLLTFRERYAEARTMISAVLNDPRGRVDSTGQVATLAQVSNEVAAGEFKLAAVALSRLRTGSPIVSRRTSLHAYYGAWVAYSRGDSDRARRHLETCFEMAAGEANHAMRARGLALRGALGLMGRDLEVAVGDLRQVSVLAARYANPTLLRHSADYVEACVLSDRRDEAIAAMESLERRLTRHESRWGELALLRCRALVMSGEESLDLFALSVEAFRTDESPYELGRTLLAMAERQMALGGVDAGRRSQIAAFTSFERSGASGWSDRAAETTRSRDARMRVLDQFDDEQREVIRLVLLGHHTKEIAGALHLSSRTVELRLTTIYRALGVASRAQLVAHLSR